GREVEWAAAVRDLLPRDRREIVGWYAGVRPSVFLADGADQLALNGELHELTIMPVRQPDAILRVNANGMRKAEQFCAPGAEECAVTIEDHHGMFVGAVETEHAISRVGRDCCGFHFDRDGHLGPILIDSVDVPALANDGVHVILRSVRFCLPLRRSGT